MASRFVPELHFTSGEKLYPTSVEYVISSSILKFRNPDGTSTIIDANPSANSLGSYNSLDYYLDNKLGTFDAIAADYSANVTRIGYYVYVHTINSSSYTVIQYWLFYAYNNGPLNDHQGDIEVVEVFLNSSSGNPQRALYSQHGSGENAAWGDVEKAGDHPVVYVAQGSHANYFRPYQGEIGIENDVVGGDGLIIKPENLTLIILGSQNWLNFGGHWGYLGTDEEVALGRAGPLGPVQNQGGIRWAQPEDYLGSSFSVSGTYFILAWLIANILLLFLAYGLIRGAWKIYGIIRLHRKSGLRVKRFLKGRNSTGLLLGLVAVLITVVALFLPWYTITASSQAGPLAHEGGATLMTIDGVRGMQVNLFMGQGGDTTSGYQSLFFMQIPFALLIAVGLVFLILDVIGVKSGKNLGLKFILGSILSLLPFILIIVFMMILPSFLPWASALVPGQTIPPQLDTMVRSIAGNPVYGTAAQSFPVVGMTTVSWGFGLGAILLLAAVALRVAAGLIMRSSPDLQEKTAGPPALQQPASPPPPAVASSVST